MHIGLKALTLQKISLMKKKFNTTGTCYPHKHYMADASRKLEQVVAIVEEGEYFIINRPRQYGKTTMLHLLNERLNQLEDYMPVKMNFQGVGKKRHLSDQAFAQMVMGQMIRHFSFQMPELKTFLQEQQQQIEDMEDLSDSITRFVHHVNKKIVLIIDEVDASSNYNAFIRFLSILRTKYLDRHSPQHATFHSIVLAGVHDIKTLKYKIRPTDDSHYNSPWNIAVDFKVRMRFSPEEIAPMLEDYSQAENVSMDIPAIAERLYYYTSGYPFLFSKICKIIVKSILTKRGKNANPKKTWTDADVEAAVQMLLKENNANFDSLIKNLDSNPKLYELVYRIIINGDRVPFNQHNPDIHQGILYGVFKSDQDIKIHNRIYEQLIYNYMVSNSMTKIQSDYSLGNHFLKENNALDIEAVLLKFQQFMKEEHSKKNDAFLETEGRLIFLAFFAPILNGKGYTFKEVQVSMEKRLDVVVTYFQHRYIIELKRWYGQKAHAQGIQQLCDYLDIHGLDKGYLLIFDPRKERGWDQEIIRQQGKEIFAVWV